MAPVHAWRFAGSALPVLLASLPLAATAGVRLESALGSDGAIDLSRLDVESLQEVMDELAAERCTRVTGLPCRWRVISVSSRALVQRPEPDAETTDAPIIAPSIGLPAVSRTDRFSSRVPAGFEQLAARRNTELDIYVDNTFAMRAGISFDSASFVFDDPFAVTEAVVAIGIPDRRTFEEFVGLDQPVEAEDLCRDVDGPRDCLTSEPTLYAFLPDMNAGRADLLMRAEQRADTSLAQARLPPARRAASLQATARVAVAAISSRTLASDAAVDASASYGPGGLFTAGSYSSTDDNARLNELFLAHQFPDHTVRIGTLNYFSNGLLLNQRLLGASAARSLNTYVNQRTLYTTPLEVSLERRSIVQLVVDGVVRHSESLPSGLQQIDTAALPGGAYQVEIRIRDAVQTRSRFEYFSRTNLLPPPNLPQYALTVASSVEDIAAANTPTPDGELFFSGSVSTRLGSRLGARLETTRYADTGIAQLQLIRLGNRYQLQIEGLVGEQSALGSVLRAAWYGNAFSVSVQGLTFRSEADLAGDPLLARFLRPDTRRIGTSFRYRAGRYLLNLRADRTRDSQTGAPIDRTRFSALLQRSLATGPLRGGTIGAEYIEDENSREVQLRLTLYGRDGNIGHRGSIGWSEPLDDRRSDGLEVAYSATWDPVVNANHDGGIPGRWSGSAYTNVNRRQGTLGVSADYVGRHLDFALVSEASDVSGDADENASLRTLLTAGTQIASDGNVVASGSPSGQTSGIIVDVDGEPVGAPFDVLVNGQRRGIGEIGRRRFIGLSPYRAHIVRLVPRTLSFAGLDESPTVVTLYPGNIETIHVDAVNRYLLVTTLIDAAGVSIDNAIITSGLDPYFIRDDGIVQIEVRPFDMLDVDLGDGRVCRVEAPDPGEEDIVIESAPLLCLE